MRPRPGCTQSTRDGTIVKTAGLSALLVQLRHPYLVDLTSRCKDRLLKSRWSTVRPALTEGRKLSGFSMPRRLRWPSDLHSTPDHRARTDIFNKEHAGAAERSGRRNRRKVVLADRSS